MLRILHLVGSPVDEAFADLSRLYATDCLTALCDAETYDPVIAYVNPGGEWQFPSSLDGADLALASRLPVAEAIRRLSDLAVDMALPQMFCRPGMTTYRSLLELIGIPYVGNRPEVMALGADKPLARAVVAASGVDVPAGEVVRSGDQPTLEPPVVVKPADSDNSFGVSLVRTDDGYPAALAAAFAHSDAVLVERYVEAGREVRCGTIERDGQLTVLPLEEYDIGNDIRGEADKLRRDPSGELQLVAKDPSRAWIVDPDDQVNGAVAAAAEACHRALGCRHYGLFDFRVDPGGRPWFLEAGLYCSFARQSVLVTMAEAAGLPVAELFAGYVNGVR